MTPAPDSEGRPRTYREDGPGSSLYNLREIAAQGPDDRHGALAEIAAWVRNYLAMPHRELGRRGTVCPFVPEALELDTVWLTVVETSPSEGAHVEDLVARAAEVFLGLEPRTGEASLFKALLMIFPNVGDEEAPDFIDGVQRKLKPLFVERGLMLGEFHRRNAAPGLYNSAFHPLRSPIPMLVVRSMVESDVVFLMRDYDPPALRVRFLTAYLERLRDKHSPHWLRVASEALRRAQSELQS